MSLPAEAVEGLVALVSRDGYIDRTEARMIVETALHAATEAMEAAARICTALDKPEHIIVAVTLAMKTIRMTAEVEGQAVRELTRDFIAENSAKVRKG